MIKNGGRDGESESRLTKKEVIKKIKIYTFKSWNDLLNIPNQLTDLHPDDQQIIELAVRAAKKKIADTFDIPIGRVSNNFFSANPFVLQRAHEIVSNEDYKNFYETAKRQEEMINRLEDQIDERTSDSARESTPEWAREHIPELPGVNIDPDDYGSGVQYKKKKKLKKTNKIFKRKNGIQRVKKRETLKGGRKKSRIPKKYIPKYLSKKNKKILRKEINKSRRQYKKQKYHTRKKIKNYKSKKSRWNNRLRNIYNIPPQTNLSIKTLSKLSKCNPNALKKIINKGMGAYYSSGSRPNQTPQSWGKARLYSALSGGPASRVDFNILKSGCKPSSKSLKLAKKNL